MKGVKLQLLGLGVILFGISLSTNNFWAYVRGFIGFLIVVIGLFSKDEKDRCDKNNREE